MSAGHTPGPWEYVPWHYVPWHVEEGPPAVRAPEGWLVCTTSSDADAKLIAAAPDLLAALAWFIDDIDGTRTVMTEFSENVERARAAIAKATGATS